MRISDWSSDVALPIFQERRLAAQDEGAALAALAAAPACQPALDHPRGELVELGALLLQLLQHLRLGLLEGAPGEPRGQVVAGLHQRGRRQARRHVDDAVFHHARRSEEHTSELQSLMRISYAVFCLKKKHHNDQRSLTDTY